MPTPDADLDVLADKGALRAIPIHERPKPRMRGRLHQGAFVASIPAGVLLVLLAPDARSRIATLIYALTLTGLFGVSAAYHLGDWSEAATVRMRRLDHSMIFVLIAGTYTPYCLLVLDGTLATVVLIAAWAGAGIGVATKFYRVDLHVLSGFMYIGLGWLVLLSLPALLRGLDPTETALVVAGGLLYSFGALVLATNKPNPWPRTFGYHEVWHAATIAAAACQYLSILLVVLGLQG
ncbi:MAG: hemolysin III family protein [Actinomycetota bacterium]|nr:hemolysin III family protein [Actinomycetota bacterium]MDH5224257.1 hemolysin III family protein [Actinomycetota bacterium]